MPFTQADYVALVGARKTPLWLLKLTRGAWLRHQSPSDNAVGQPELHLSAELLWNQTDKAYRRQIQVRPGFEYVSCRADEVSSSVQTDWPAEHRP